MDSIVTNDYLQWLILRIKNKNMSNWVYNAARSIPKNTEFKILWGKSKNYPTCVGTRLYKSIDFTELVIYSMYLWHFLSRYLKDRSYQFASILKTAYVLKSVWSATITYEFYIKFSIQYHAFILTLDVYIFILRHCVYTAHTRHFSWIFW